MDSLYKTYQPVFKFLITFLVVYGVLSFLYYVYISNSNSAVYYPDYVTNLVAKQSATLLSSFGNTAEVLPHPDEPSMKLIYNNYYVLRIIEGCNAISVIILFLAFIIAFSDTFKSTLLYCVIGTVIIYSFNLIRIALLSVGLYHYPEQEVLLHQIIFPLVIYGTVVVLWLMWVNRFSKLKKHD